MASLSPEQIKEIADYLDMGFRCFWHSENKQVFIVPDVNNAMFMDTDVWDEDLKKLEENFLDYQEINRMDSRESFEMMEDFIETIPDSSRIKTNLINALNRRKPFREFRAEIDDSGDYREEWFAFKDQKLQEWVSEQVKRFD